MKDAEAVALYHQAISATPSEPTEFGADMWCETLRDLRYGDARQALINLIKTQTFVSPNEIRKEVHRIRERRIAEHPEPAPPPDLTPAQTIDWLRDTRRRIADGETVTDTARGELQHHNIRELTGGAA